MKVAVKIINAFSVGSTGGNPAGVVLEADHLSLQDKQAVAARLGFPETAFVSQSAQADLKLDFFTPTKQIPHCGHATIATFTYLKQIGKITADHSSKETIDGIRQIRYNGSYAFMEQKAPGFLVPEEQSLILASLGLQAADLKEELMPTIVNTGNAFLIVPVKSEALLAGIVPELELISQVSAKYNLIGYYVYAPTEKEGIAATARMFGPYYGIEEEAATGMAAGPLACFLYEKENRKETQFVIEQGRFMTMPSPSIIQVHLTLEQGNIVRLYAGGNAYVSGDRIIEL